MAYVALENYECDGCRNDGNTHGGCGDCPHNDKRQREWERKYNACSHNVGPVVRPGGCYGD